MIAELITRVSEDLNDHAPGHEFTTWGADQIRAYLLEGLQIAYTIRPDLFLHEVILTLTPGARTQKPCDCTQIRRVLGVCNADGRVLYPLRKKRQSDRLLWTGRSCPVDPKHYRVQEYSIDADGDYIFVEPPPPAGQTVYLLVECAINPTSITDSTDVATELAAPIVQWALFRAKMVDGENNAAIVTVAREHRSTFFTLLNAEATNKSSVDSDRNAGTRSLTSLSAAEQGRSAEG